MAASSFAIRATTRDDAPLLAKLASQTFTAAFASDNSPENLADYVETAFSLNTILAELNDPTSTFLLASSPLGVGGYAKLRRGPSDPSISGPKPLELQRIYADDRLKGAGVGSALLDFCIHQGRQESFQTLWLGVWEHNHAAIGFYAHKGFVTAGTRAFNLGTEVQTDLVMQLDLRG